MSPHRFDGARSHATRRRFLWAITGVSLADTVAATQRPSPEPGRDRQAAPIAPFSSMPIGDQMPSGWREQRIGKIPSNRHRLVADAGQSVLQIDSSASASSLVHGFSPPALARGLSWRWRTERWPEQAGALGQKAGDDFSLRLYVLFDYPLAKLPWAQRLALELMRASVDPNLPGATLCYVADPRAAPGTWLDSPYTSRVRLAVLRGVEAPGSWWSESRDLLADFQRAFGAEYGPGMPPISAVAVAADTDQGGGRTRAWFSDLSLW